MNLLFSLLFLSLLFVSPSTFADDGPVIVLIHGRGQTGRDLKVVEKEFVEAFKDAERSLVGEEIVKESDIAFVWYADLLEAGLTPPGGPSISCSYAGAEDQERQNWWDSLRKQFIDMATVLHLDSLGLREFTSDTFVYLSNGQTRCETNARLPMAIYSHKFANRPVILVAHSMGGIVSFASLERISRQEPPRKIAIAKFITVGTQIGEPLVLRGIGGAYIEPPVPLPIVIGSWTNFRNKNDPLAFDTKGRFKATDETRLPVDISIDQPGDRHAFKTYISNVQVISTVLGAWCKAQHNETKPAKCAQIRQ